jgi:tripartite-type tricarboxylate transporter receptor subunit TctC
MTCRLHSLLFLLILAAAATGSGPATNAEAQPAEEFFRSKKELNLVTSSSAGGGYDQYSRLVARHMSKYLPGNPNIIVQNMVGGGGIRAANYIYNVAPKDGTVFCLIDRGMPTAPLLYGEKSQARFDAVKFSWIGSIMRETGMGVLSGRSVVKNIEDAKKQEIFFGTTGPETDPAMFVRLVNELLGTKIKAIHGYKGQPEEFQAAEKGELDGLFMSGWSGPGRAYVRDQMSRGQMRLLVQMAAEKDPQHQDTPTIVELVTAPEDRQIIALVLGRMTLGRPFIAPPGVANDRVALLRAAFRQAVDDPELRADAERQRLAIDPTWGAEAEDVIKRLYQTPPQVVERTRKIVAVAPE